MLIYHPAYDAYHCVFRMLLIFNSIKEIEIEKARLLDFYLMFPSAISKIRLPANLKEARRAAKNLSNVYHDPINAASTFRDMGEIQQAALKCIAASGLIDMENLAKGLVKRTAQELPVEIQKKISEYMEKRQPITEIILSGLAKIPLRGDDGLKHRTELMEHRYDIA